MALDDLLKGLSVFQSGVQSLAQNMAIGDAQKQIADINAQVQDQNEKQAAAQAVGQDLAMRLMQAKASPDQIASVTGSLVPSANNSQTMQAQKDMQQVGFAQQTKEKEMDRDLALELQRMKTSALLGKQANKQTGFLTDYQKRYNKESEKPRGALQAMNQVRDILQSGNPVGDQAVGTFFARASGDVGNLSEYEQKKYGGSKALLAKVAQAKSEWASGKMSAENRKFLMDLADTYSQANQRKMDEIADRYANQASSAATKSGFEHDPAELRSMITGQREQKQAQARTLTKKQYSAKQNKTRLIYSDGTEEIVDGQR